MAQRGGSIGLSRLPALAPILVACAVPLLPQAAFLLPVRRTRGGYLLVRKHESLRFGLSQAFTLGGPFVFSAPAVMMRALGSSLSGFITKQVLGVLSFIVASKFTSAFAKRYGAECMILFGAALSAMGSIAMLVFALFDGRAACGRVAVHPGESRPWTAWPARLTCTLSTLTGVAPRRRQKLLASRKVLALNSFH